MCEKTALRRIQEPKEEEVTGGWTKLHDEKLHDFRPSLNIITMIEIRMRLAGHKARLGEMRNTYIILVDKSKERRPAGRCSVDGE
jgi:hypothetical protein